MDPLVDEARAGGGPEREVNLLIEKGFLLLGSIEFQIDEHLMAHGTRIDPETRFFMAQVRDAAGDAAAKLLDEARNRIDAAPAELEPEPEPGREDTEAVEAPLPMPACPLPAKVSSGRAARQKRRRVFVRRAVAKATLGTAFASVLLALLLGGQVGKSPVAGAEAAPGAGDHMPSVLRAAANPAERAPAKASQPARWVTKLAQTAPEPDRPAAGIGAGPDGPDLVTHPTGREPLPGAAPPGLTIAMADRTPFPPYPDPLAGLDPAWSGRIDREAAAAAEEALALSQRERREVQRRLALADFDPQVFDGIFGPDTRDALGAWQEAAGLAPTGYLDGASLTLLRERTASDYRAWKAAERERARREDSRTAVLESPVPPASPGRMDKCRRLPSGRILYGHGVRCDFRGLRENLAQIFG